MAPTSKHRAVPELRTAQSALLGGRVGVGKSSLKARLSKLSMAILAALSATSLAITPSPSHALTLTELSSSIDACHLQAPQVEDTTGALENAGWTLLPEGEMPADIIELLIWPQVLFYANGDTGGAALQSIVDIQRKTVAGFARKKDIPQSKTRILTRQLGRETEAALVFWLQPDPSVTQIVCRFALSPHSLLGHTKGGFAPPTTADTSEASVTRVFSATVMNAGFLAQQINAPVTVSGTLETQLSFPSQQ